MTAKTASFGSDFMRFLEKSVLLQTLDHLWKEHLLALDHLRQGIGLRAYGQRDPLNEYKAEAFALFSVMLEDLKEQVSTALAHVELGTDPTANAPIFDPSEMYEQHGTYASYEGDMVLADPQSANEITPMPIINVRQDAVDPNRPETWSGTPRNALCPCGSGKKFKHCHGNMGAA